MPVVQEIAQFLQDMVLIDETCLMLGDRLILPKCRIWKRLGEVVALQSNSTDIEIASHLFVRFRTELKSFID